MIDKPDWADEIAIGLHDEIAQGYRESSEPIAAALRKAKADGVRLLARLLREASIECASDKAFCLMFDRIAKISKLLAYHIKKGKA